MKKSRDRGLDRNFDFSPDLHNGLCVDQLRRCGDGLPNRELLDRQNLRGAAGLEPCNLNNETEVFQINAGARENSIL